MATREIITTIALDGEKEFKKELAAAGRELRLLGSELRAEAAAFENAGDAQQFLTRKSAILRKELDQQEQIVKALEGALRDANQKWGEGSTEADGYAIRLNNAREKAEKMRKELKQTERELSDVGDEMDDATKDTQQLARALKDDLEDGASDAKSSLEKLTDSLNDLKNMQGIQIGIDLAENVWDALEGLMDFTNEQRTNIRENRLTDARAIAAGYDPVMLQNMIRNATAITGDMEGARSAYGMLTAIPGMSEEWLRIWSDMLLGADLKLPELTFDALAEGLQETLSNRVLAGPFLELLERSGYNEKQIDLYNEQLRATQTLEDAMNVVMTPLATANVVEGGGSYADFLRRFMVENEDIIEAEEAQTKLADAMTELAENLLPITTFLTETLADFINLVTEALGFFGIKEAKSEELDDEIEKYDPERAAEIRAAQAEVTPVRQKTIWDELREKPLQPVWPTVDNNVTLYKGAVPTPEELGEFWRSIPRGLGNLWRSVFDKNVEYEEAIGPMPVPDTTNAVETIEEIKTELQTLENEASTTGADVGANLSTNIETSTAAAVASAQALADQVSAALNSIAVPNVGAMMQAAMAGGNMMAAASGSISVVLNGRKVGQAITPTVSTQQARSMRR